MAIKIHSTKDVCVQGIKVVVYGAAGIGKTVLCSTAPSPLIISAEKGLLSLAGMDIPYIEIRNINDVGEVYNFITKSAEAKQYNTICIDSISELTETCLTEIKKQLISESDSGKIDARQAYGKVAESIGAMIRRFRDLLEHDVVFTSKMKRIDDSEGNPVSYEPYLPGKVLPFNMPYLVDELFCMRFNKANERIIQTKAERRFIAKDRSAKLAPEEHPNLTHIFNKIRAKQ